MSIQLSYIMLDFSPINQLQARRLGMSVGSYEEHNRNSNPEVNEGASESIPSFLLKTYQILENSSYADIICWTKTGEGFVVKKVKEFAQKILPAHFRHSNYTSFVRQLNMYDFHKTRQENQQNAFKNFMFKRGHRHLLKDIQRKDYKKNKQTRNQVPNERIQTQRPPQRRQDGDSHIMKNFYSNSIGTLENYSANLQNKITELASIREVSIDKLSIMSLLDLMFEAKRINRNSMLAVSQLTKNWESFISLKDFSIKFIGQHQKQEKQHHLEPHAFTTANSLPQ